MGKQSGLYALATGCHDAMAGNADQHGIVWTADKNRASGATRGETQSVLAYWRAKYGRKDLFCVRIM